MDKFGSNKCTNIWYDINPFHHQYTKAVMLNPGIIVEAIPSPKPTVMFTLIVSKINLYKSVIFNQLPVTDELSSCHRLYVVIRLL